MQLVLRSLLVTCVFGLAYPTSSATVAAQPSSPPTTARAAPTALAADASTTPADSFLDLQFKPLLESLKSIDAERTERKNQLRKAQDESEKRRLNEEIERLATRSDELRMSFEELAAGGVRVAAFEQEEQIKFDWQKELEEVIRPLFDEVKKLTERPRTIERLRGEQMLYEKRSQLAERALAQAEETLKEVQNKDVKKEIASVVEAWRSRRDQARSRLKAITAQLDRLLAPDEENQFSASRAAQEFFSGHGLNLFLAIIGFGVTYAAMLGLRGLVRVFAARRRRDSAALFTRAAMLLIHVSALVIGLLVTALVLYVRADWLLLALLILFVIAMLWGLRHSLPRYVREARILLNMGGVREEERVVYNGVPWRVTNLNVTSILENPLLRGGVLRLPLDRMVDLQSRPAGLGEPWFPTREGDCIMIDGDTFGKVLCQTPEFVQVQIVGAVTTFTTPDFIAKSPRNLSQEGFAVPVVFGLDYQHQGEILDEVIDKLRQHFQAALQGQPFHEHVTNVLIEFKEAASSSLNVLIVLGMAGRAAEHYWAIQRFMQRTAVDACNKYQWVIPFDQLTVHANWPAALTKPPS